MKTGLLIYKMTLFVVGFCIKSILAVFNLLILNLVIDNLKK